MKIVQVYRRNPAHNRYIDAEQWGVFHRERLGEGARVHVGPLGLQCSQEWHRSPGKAPAYDEAEEQRGERAVLLQSASHVRELAAAFPELAEGLREAGAFGENALCEGLQAATVCLGDVYAVGGSSLRLQAVSPRRPCANVDKRHGQMYGAKGVRAYCAQSGRGGTFFRVLSEGALFEGAELELVSRREEGGGDAWSMERLSRTLYAKADARYHVPLPWAGTRSELTALCCDPVLAHVEWQEVLRELRERELKAGAPEVRLLRLGAAAIGAALLAASWRSAPPIRPDWAAWCWAVLSGRWSGENTLLVIEFNMMGLWPLVLASQCRHGLFGGGGMGKTPPALPLWPWLATSCCLGCFAAAPGIALCAASALSSAPPVRAEGRVSRLLGRAEFAAGLAVAALCLCGWGCWRCGGEGGDGGGAAAELGGWHDLVRSEGFAFVMTLDFLAFWALSMLLACTIDRVNGAAGGGSCSSARWALTLLPLLGSIAWLMGRQRPPTTQASAAPSHSKAKAS